jgi:tetratricopeptide (TPR) repeat protein
MVIYNTQKYFSIIITTTLLMLVLSLSSKQEEYNHRYLGIVCMVKNEATVLVNTLQEFANTGIDHYLILDTGSTDGTQQVAWQFFENNNIQHGYIHEEPFVDFATSRNRALELAEYYLPDVDFLLMLDAEWYINNTKGLIEFCKQQASLTQKSCMESYLILLKMGNLEFYAPRLIRNESHLRFEGVVHEIIPCSFAAKIPQDIYFNVCPSSLGIEKSQARYTRDRDLLLAHHEQNPQDPRTAFYLAQTYGCLGDWPNAYKYYKKRVSLEGWHEENFITWLRLGEATEYLGEDRWDEALGYYLRAFATRPCRIESLIRIIDHYLMRGETQLAYLFLRRALEIPFPAQDILFVEADAYSYKRYDQLGRCGWYIGEFDLGEWGVRKALLAHDDYPHLHQNLTFYENRKKSLSRPAQESACLEA